MGVYIDQNLSWYDHIGVTCSKVAKGVGIIGRMKYILPVNVLRMLYNTLVLPHISYCSVIWSGAYASYLQKLIVLQNRAIRHITRASSRDHITKHYRSLNLLKLQDHLKLNDTIFVFNWINDKLPKSFASFFIRNTLVHNYNTRRANDLHKQSYTTTSSARSLRNRAISLWNSLPDGIKSQNSLTSFKRSLHNHFINVYATDQS